MSLRRFASRTLLCGFLVGRGLTRVMTDVNYTQFVELYSRYAERGLRILAFPCNQFGKQEPGTEEEIKAFAETYGVKFDMFSKVEVNGDNAHPLWKWLKNQPKGRGTLGKRWKRNCSDSCKPRLPLASPGCALPAFLWFACEFCLDEGLLSSQAYLVRQV
ncbi:Phospholipid hydroperoxide glutathione peroxidase, mitochondrial [Ophiophagus hannah]|uniref:phospholipid-hydroperoxide glutathione peroxidase n=1 Tax=Ophiophagus hannah TaxID=8665 RepID=V8NPK8_OPHHA|nr:Phospholipid hydroperoxide glutathione peroxidase, mitochondrial [Ophiophagus hannah]